MRRRSRGSRGCEIVGVCDRELLMAQQLYKRFPIKQYFSDLPKLLKRSKARCSPHHDAAAEPLRNCEDLSGMGMPRICRKTLYDLGG